MARDYKIDLIFEGIKMLDLNCIEEQTRYTELSELFTKRMSQKQKCNDIKIFQEINALKY